MSTWVFVITGEQRELIDLGSVNENQERISALASRIAKEGRSEVIIRSIDFQFTLRVRVPRTGPSLAMLGWTLWLELHRLRPRMRGGE